MSHAKLALFVALGTFAVVFVGYWVASVRRSPGQGGPASPSSGVVPSPGEALVGFLTNFFDTLGIGSFATTTSIFKLRGMVADERIPGTLNVGHTLPTVVQAFIYIAIVAVEAKTLILLIGASVLGSWLGAGVVAGWPRRKVQIGMGSALVVAAVIFFLQALKLMPGGGDALALDGWRFWLGIVGNFVLGALMTLGIGLYAPCMILVSLLGMDSKAAFPIMMGSCAFLMPVASMRFVGERSFALKPSLGLALGGIPGVLIAAFVVGSMDLDKVRWLVILVVLYTAGAMLFSAFREARRAAPQSPPALPVA